MTCISCGDKIETRLVRYTKMGKPICEDCLRGLETHLNPERLERDLKRDDFFIKVSAVCCILMAVILAFGLIQLILG